MRISPEQLAALGVLNHRRFGKLECQPYLAKDAGNLNQGGVSHFLDAGQQDNDIGLPFQRVLGHPGCQTWKSRFGFRQMTESSITHLTEAKP